MSDASCWYYSIDVHEVCHVALHLNVRSCIIGVTSRYLSMVTRVLPRCFAYLTLLLQAVHNFFKQYSPLPKLGTSTVTGSGVSDYGGKPMSVIKVSYEGRGQKRKRDDNGRRGGRGGDKSVGRGGGRGGRGPKEGPSKEWPGGTKKYCKFALAKTNMDTQVKSVSCIAYQYAYASEETAIIDACIVHQLPTSISFLVIPSLCCAAAMSSSVLP